MMAEAVTCAPNKLVFSLRLGEPSSTALRLENPSDERVAFKVRAAAAAAGWRSGGMGRTGSRSQSPCLGDADFSAPAILAWDR